MAAGPAIAKVVIDLAVRQLDRIFDYEVPAELSDTVRIGSSVIVPFGRGKQVGYVVGFTERSEVEKLLPIETLVREQPVFSQKMVELCGWIAKHYIATVSEALRLAIPPGHASKIAQQVRIVSEPDCTLSARQSDVYEALKRFGGTARADSLKEACGGKNISSAISKLCSHGVLERYFKLEQPKVKEATARFASLIAADLSAEAILTEFKKSPKQRRILEMLLEKGDRQVSQLLADVQAPYSSLTALVKRRIVAIDERTVTRDPQEHFVQQDVCVDLTGEQHAALTAISSAIDKGSTDVFLLQGVTGSGKTEVYLRAIRRALELGKSAIVLVPEIALTAQVVARFRARFGDAVAVLHSALGAGERFDQWRGIQEGRYRVVVGARSALFAPIEHLGVIVVDEEHEASYKQGRSPRYNARDVAIKRAEIEGACVVLGSATPSLEAKWRSETGVYRPLFLHRRVHKRDLPRIEVVDMRDEPRETDERPILSGLLRLRLTEALDGGHKAILFLNRRGFSNFIVCEDCGFVPKCRSCAISLTYHSVNNSLRCHHCNFAAKAPSACPKCKSPNIRYPGAGTQRVEAELSRLYPDVPVVRMDADTTARKGAHQKKLAAFGGHKSAILLGTQMIAKGLDFPDITLVGVINADTSLHLPDFRAGEHTFQMLMQVAGRAGRGDQPGLVVIQTHSPDSDPLTAVLVGSYDEFYKQEIEYRRELSYPPFSAIVRLLFTGQEPKAVIAIAKRAAKFIEAAGLNEALELIGPSPAPLLKVKGEYRWHIMLKVRHNLTVKSFLEDNVTRFVPDAYRDSVALSIDVDPVWVL